MYKLLEHGVKRLSDGAAIPNDATNVDWQEYQQWLMQGGVTEPMYTKDEAYEKRKLDIVQLSAEKQSGAWDYLGNTFSLTTISKVIKDKTAAKVKIFKVKDIDNKPVTFSSGDYGDFADAMIDKIDDIEDNEIVHLDSLEVMYEVPSSTATDLLNYDITGGW